MKTTSISVMNLCVPCENRCRYCLLSYDGRVEGADYRRSESYAKRFFDWLQENRRDVDFNFGFGYSMEHPKLLEAIDFCRSIGSAGGRCLQFDGMQFRTEAQLRQLLGDLQNHGIQLIDLTFYGTRDYHDRFAARKGDFQLMADTLAAANQVGLDVTVSIPLTDENADQIDDLILELERYQVERIVCFVPHSEGRGRLLDPVRLSGKGLAHLGSKARQCFNDTRFRTERNWLARGEFPAPQKRALAVTLTPDNIGFFEQLGFAETIAYLEELDDTYYAAIPDMAKLAECFGDPGNDRYYSLRDLYLHYQRRYIVENHLQIYDVNDERHCFSRRF